MNNNQNINQIPTQVVPQTQPVQQPINQTQQVQQVQPPQHVQKDFNSLSPLEKQQLIDKATAIAKAKCQIEEPKRMNMLYIFCIFMVILCIAAVIILNVIK